MNITPFVKVYLIRSKDLPVAKLFTTPIQRADAIAASTALPPFFKTRFWNQY